MEFIYIDHLSEYMKERVKRYFEDRKPEDLPKEFEGISQAKLIYGVAELATPTLRKTEDDAILAAVERFASLIRYSKKEK